MASSFGHTYPQHFFSSVIFKAGVVINALLSEDTILTFHSTMKSYKIFNHCLSIENMIVKSIGPVNKIKEISFSNCHVESLININNQ